MDPGSIYEGSLGAQNLQLNPIQKKPPGAKGILGGLNRSFRRPTTLMSGMITEGHSFMYTSFGWVKPVVYG